MSAAIGLALDAHRLRDRAEAERMTLLDEPGRAPAIIPEDADRVWTMDDAGVVSADWQFAESVDWWRAVAWRAETSFGETVDLEGDDDDGWWS